MNSDTSDQTKAQDPFDISGRERMIRELVEYPAPERLVSFALRLEMKFLLAEIDRLRGALAKAVS
jgi:hypothetical protein